MQPVGPLETSGAIEYRTTGSLWPNLFDSYLWARGRVEEGFRLPVCDKLLRRVVDNLALMERFDVRYSGCTDMLKEPVQRDRLPARRDF